MNSILKFKECSTIGDSQHDNRTMQTPYFITWVTRSVYQHLLYKLLQ